MNRPDAQPATADIHAKAAAPVDRYAALVDEAKAIRGVSLWKDAGRRLRKNRAAMASLFFLIAMGAVALFTPILPFQSPTVQDLIDRQFQTPNLTPVRLGQQPALQFEDNSLVQQLTIYDVASAEPSDSDRDDAALANTSQHPFEKLWNSPGPITRAMIRARVAVFGDWAIPSICGTDALGRDLLSRIFWGARVSLAVGIVATIVSLIIGVAYGAIAGYFGGWVDAVMMRIVDVLYSVPFIFVVIFLITIISQPDIKSQLEAYGFSEITVFFIVIGAIYWLTMARVVRGQVISLKHEQFIEAARTIGASKPRIVFLHLVPNIMGVVIVYLSLTIPSVMLFEAFLSFLGLGVSAPDVSWGLLVNKGIEVITPIRSYWWLVVFPGLAFAATLFALNFLGDGLRDALDPRMKNR